MKEAIDRLEMAVEQFKSADDGIVELAQPFAIGWNKRRLLEQLYEIDRYYVSNSESVIPLSRRRKIERLAKRLRDELAGLGGLDADFLGTLHALAQPHPAHLRAARSESNRGGAVDVKHPGPNGVRKAAKPGSRTGQRTLKSSVLGMIVRAYFEACAEPGFSKNGPLFRFANAVGEWILGESDPFTSDAVKAEFQVRRKKDGDALERRQRRMRAWMNFSEPRKAGLFFCPEGFDDPASKNEDPER
jgi:hypothetical protein